jgi:hypothetical protein
MAGRTIRPVTYLVEGAVSYGPPGVWPYRAVDHKT